MIALAIVCFSSGRFEIESFEPRYSKRQRRFKKSPGKTSNNKKVKSGSRRESKALYPSELVRLDASLYKQIAKIKLEFFNSGEQVFIRLITPPKFLYGRQPP